MLKKERNSKDSLINSYYSCALFKKYYQYDLWFDSLGEYNNIKYCKNYFQKYIYCWIHNFLLEHFNFSLVIFLYKSPCFIKFVDSGFFKYLDFHFLLLFSKNSFSFDLMGKQKIKVFVESYFETFLKRGLEKDILILVIKALNEIILEVLTGHLTNRLKLNQNDVKKILLNNKVLFELVKIKKIYLVGIFYFKSFIERAYYKSRFIHFISICIDHTLKSLFLVAPNKKVSFNILKFVLKSTNTNENKNLKFYLKSVKINEVLMEEFFMKYHKKGFYRFNKEIHPLVESFDILDRVISKQISINLYKNTDIIFKGVLSTNSLVLKKSLKSCKTFKKRYNNSFVKYKYKRKFYYKDLNLNLLFLV